MHNNTRKRACAASSLPDSSSASASTGYEGYNDRLWVSHIQASNGVIGANADDDGGQRKSPHEKEFSQPARRVFRKKTSQFSSQNLRRAWLNVISKVGNLRVVDVLFILGVGSKLVSTFLSWNESTTYLVHEFPSKSNSPSFVPFPRRRQLEEDWALPKWVTLWKEHKMPFYSPLLYNRGNDDYSMGGDSRLDDDAEESKQHTGKYQSMISRHITHYLGMYSHHEDELKTYGIAVVDDIVFDADGHREITQLALEESFSSVGVSYGGNINYEAEMERPDHQLAIGFNDHDISERHFYTDDGEEYDTYYAFDDDFVRGSQGTGVYDKRKSWKLRMDKNDDLVLSKEEQCIRPSFFRMYHPNCNDVHSAASGHQWLLGEEIYTRRWEKKAHSPSKDKHLSKYLGRGYYRDAFLIQRPHFSSGRDLKNNKWEGAVFKSMRSTLERTESGKSEDDEVMHSGWGFDESDKYTFMEHLEDMRKDAMVMELLTSSPRASNIYTHCAMSSIIEFAPIEIEQYITPVYGIAPKKIGNRGAMNASSDAAGPLNDHIPPQEKLEIALEMAKCIAAMHGYPGGIIAHVDIQLAQFFRGEDGMIKIVDFNRAETLLYDIKQERYCKFVNGPPADGVFRAPEENVDAPLNEKIDVYSLGNIFFSLLTGITVFQDEEPTERSRMIGKGETEKIDDFYYERSAAEAALADVIRWCWEYDVDSRPEIFEVVEYLEHAVVGNYFGSKGPLNRSERRAT